jgi:Na+-transporting NADH:ubiquinone oxidoreductase subunit NqrA
VKLLSQYGPASAEIFAIKPKDFVGLTPKLLVKAGANVVKQELHFYDKRIKNQVLLSSWW